MGVLAAISTPVAAAAHALPQSEIPAAGATVGQAPTVVEIVFGEHPDAQLSAIIVVDASGVSVTAGPTQASQHNPDALQVHLRSGLGNGVYTVSWRSVSSDDGHLATGSYAFGVGVPAATSSSSGRLVVRAQGPSPLTVAARGLLYAGAMLVLGLAVFIVVALRATPRWILRLIAAASAVAAAGTLGVAEAQREAAGISIRDLFASSLGAQVEWRAVAAVLLLGAGALALRRAARVMVTGTAVAAALVLWFDVAYSHAGAQSPVALNLFLQWLHVAAAAVWIGGLVALVITLRSDAVSDRAAIARRFSLLAGMCIVAVAGTGTVRAVVEVRTWAELVSTAFGVLILVKVGLFLMLATLGALNRWRHVPRAAQLLHRLRRAASAEVLAGTAAVLVAAALVNVAPPVSSAAAVSGAPSQAADVTVSASDAATTVRFSLTVSPGRAGLNTFTAQVRDHNTGEPIVAGSVALHFRMPLRPQLAESTLTLRRGADGSLSARGANLSLPGIWLVDAIVDAGQRSAVVHLQLATNEPAPPLAIARFGNGLPTTYTVQLGSGRSLQVYLDPDRPGAVEFHVTLFGPGGTSELQTSSLTIAETTTGTPIVLRPRRLDPVGHFVADATVPGGLTRFDIIALTASGETFTTYLSITPGT